MAMMLRKHQSEFENIIDEIISGKDIRDINVIATPGAGKSSLPIQAARLIYEDLADAILWVVPRSSLQDQGERGFIDPFFRKMFQHEFIIRSSTNEMNPRRGTNGFATTYQAISIDKFNTVLNEVFKHRYIIFLDEFQFLEKDSPWHKSIDPIVKKCKYVVKMTGTLGRGDKRPIAYVNYRSGKPTFNESNSSRLIKYSRTDALREKAILPIEFHLSDGSFEWKNEKGKHKNISSFKSAVSGKEITDSLYTALHSNFAEEMINDCVNHWRKLKQFNPRSKLLVITADIESAKLALNYLKKINVTSRIATSHVTSEAIENIKTFKGAHLDCLVTIAMAYVGLDVPSITHECVLTNIRAKEWIEQMVARGVRIDKSAGPYENQMCYVFAPADKKFRKVVEMIEKEQLTSIENQNDDEIYCACRKCKKQSFNGKCLRLPEPKYINKILWDGAECEYFEQKPPEEQKKITPISSTITARERFKMGFYGHKSDYIPESMPEIVQKTTKEQETEIRNNIHNHIKKYCWENRVENQQINHELKVRFGKARNLMMLSELKDLYKYVKISYRIDVPIKRKRVTNKIVKVNKEITQSMYNPVDQLLPGFNS